LFAQAVFTFWAARLHAARLTPAAARAAQNLRNGPKTPPPGRQNGRQPVKIVRRGIIYRFANSL